MPTAAEFFSAYLEWEEQRKRLSAQEEKGGPPPGDWHDSDDTGIELLEQAFDLLRVKEPLPFPEDCVCSICESDRLQLVESGYTRTFASVSYEEADGRIVDVRLSLPHEPEKWVKQQIDVHFLSVCENYPASFSDEGDGERWLECSSCLQQYAFPDGEIEIDYR